MRKRWKRVAVSVLTAGMLFFGGIAIPPLNGGKVYAGTISPTTENKGNMTITLTIKGAASVTTAPTAKTLTYTGSAQALVNAGAANGGTMQYSLDGTNYSATIPTGTTAGNYTVYYKVVGDADHNDSESSNVAVSIGKATPTVTAPMATNPVYTGSAQNLITAGTTTGGTMQYSLDNSTYSTEIPQGTEKQAYTVYYKVVGNENYNDVAAQTLTSTISDKPSATITTAPTAKTLTYTGSAQALVNAGAANGGTMQYSLDGTNYSVTIPTGTAAGTYTVYYKAVGDAEHNDSAGGNVTVTIGKATPTVTAPTANTLTYTGSVQNLITAGTTTGGTMQYSTDGSNYSTEIPQGTDVKTFTVYYKVVGDTNYKDVAARTLTVTIAAKPEEPTPDNGNVEIPADEQAGNFAAAGLENTAEELKASVLTDEDKAAIAAGKDVAVWLEMKDNSATVASEDKTLVVSTVTQSLGNGYEVGSYLDLILWKQTTGEAKVKVAEVPNGKVKVNMTIPENLRKVGATYKIIRIHNGVASVIDTTVDETTWKLTFETDAFSTYALAYTGTESPEPETDWLEPLRTKLHIAGEAGGAQTVEYTGNFSLPIEFMTYLKEHPQVTLIFHTTYEGEEITVAIPGSKAIVDETIGWYGPLWLKAHYGAGTANAGTITAPKTGDTLHGYNFWLILMLTGAFGAAGAIVTLKKKNKIFVSDK